MLFCSMILSRLLTMLTEYRTHNCLAIHNFYLPSGTPTEGIKNNINKIIARYFRTFCDPVVGSHYFPPVGKIHATDRYSFHAVIFLVFRLRRDI